MKNFERELARLNEEQRKAVSETEGPVLVIAGPGTGKTQLLSMRVANILRQTDALPSNILCLTFTDNAARNMRERLAQLMGQPAYHVSIHTFHSFGTDIINQYPDCFTDRYMLQQIDELGRYELLREIFETLPHDNPLSAKVGDQFIMLKDCLKTISWLKQNALAPREMQEILRANGKFFETASAKITEAFSSSPSAKQLQIYKELLETIEQCVVDGHYYGFPAYASVCATELAEAISSTNPSGRHAQPITAWRNRWCKKNAEGQHVFKDDGPSQRKMQALTAIYRQFNELMAERGLYDFDDMVIEAVHAMENNKELLHNLQERYQYVLVDEFQDTNKAQLRMLNALGNNPVNENRPNIMAVGDDDQAIYAFQGAEVSNMAIFASQYDRPLVVSLTDNYRSSHDILTASGKLADQITNRLGSIVPLAGKNLHAKAEHGAHNLANMQFISELAQYDWVAAQIKDLLMSGVAPSDIAVIAPRHKYLERLIPYLGSRRIPVAYERRENILEAPIIKQLLTMARLVVALAENRQYDADVLLAQVLSYDFWEISNDNLVKISLDAHDGRHHWLEALRSQDDKKLKAVSDWFIDLARRSSLEPMEYILDKLTGETQQGRDNEYDELLLPQPNAARSKFICPLRNYYFNDERYEQSTDSYLTLLGQLSTLRQRLRQWKPNSTQYIKDFVEFSDLHQAAGLKIVDSNPHTQSTSAVQVMTVHKAKGLEFGNVFIINAQDEVWGPTAKTSTSRITLPKNLPVAPAGNDNNDKLRILFVAMTRAKHSLYITGYGHDLNGKPSPALSFLVDPLKQDQPIHDELALTRIKSPESIKSVEILSTDWAYRYRQIIADRPALFEPILSNYKLSVTHLNNFIDIKDNGPQHFLTHNLLRFPEALAPSAAYGDAIHKTLQWLHTELRANGSLPDSLSVKDYFTDILARKHLKSSDLERLGNRGREMLDLYLRQRAHTISAQDIFERGFGNEGVVVAGASLSGKIDKLHFMSPTQVRVIDFKTGKPSISWQGRDDFEKVKLHKYRQQLMFYKLLVENSASFSGKLSVMGGALEYVEPENGHLRENLELEFNSRELERFSKLIGKVWDHIQELNFPYAEGYSKNIQGIKQFEKDLLEGII